jgi:hypothetical protein
MVRLMIRRPLVGLALFAAVALAGCQDDEVRHYKVARVSAPQARLLAAILPVGEKNWFASVTGPAPAIVDLLPKFESFVQSLRFPENERRRVTWELPADWHREPNRDRLRYATFRAGKNALEVRLYTFGPESGDLLANVNRWRGQIGLDKITNAELPTVTRPITVNGISGVFVDMTGPGANAEAPVAPPAPSNEPTSVDKPNYDVPEIWQPQLPGAMQIATFKISAGDQSAKVSVSSLPGDGGGLLANVNRWRGQVNLPPTTAAELEKEAKKLESKAGPIDYLDMNGPKERMLVGILPHGGQSWFFKMTGPADLVGAQRANFEAFVKSLRFEAGTK